MLNIVKEGDARILVVTDFAKGSCDHQLSNKDAKWCRFGVNERMDSDLRTQWQKTHKK